MCVSDVIARRAEHEEGDERRKSEAIQTRDSMRRRNNFVAKFAMDRSPIQRTFVPVALERGWNVAFSSNVVKPMTAMYISQQLKI